MPNIALAESEPVFTEGLDPKPFQDAIDGGMFPCYVAANRNLDTFEVIEIAQQPLSKDAEKELADRGLHFIGVVSITPDGKPRCHFCLALELDESQAIVNAYVGHIAATIAKIYPSALSGTPDA